MTRRSRVRPAWLPTALSRRAEPTGAEQAWDRSRRAAVRWAGVGTFAGLLFGLIAFAPAAWIARAVATRSGGYLLLADARGSVWSGSAVAVLTGGPGSRDASSLPGRLEWTMRPRLGGFELVARHACCLNGPVALRLEPGFTRTTATLRPPAGWVAQWPSAWLIGLGTPWNTLQLGGTVRLASTGLALRSIGGRWRLDGRADIDLLDAASRLTTLPTLGSYRLGVAGDPAGPDIARLTLSTLGGALTLLGSGSWGSHGIHFRGEARAAPADAAALSNLLNIIGRRDGARAVISIG